jgi:RNA polymerase-binding transcription factor
MPDFRPYLKPDLKMDKYKRILLGKKAEIERAVRDIDDIAVEKVADQLDEVQLATIRELSITHLDRETALLRRIRSALRRIEDSSYGTCSRCEEPIPHKRLDAIPWAGYCVKCQEAVDAEQAAGLHDAHSEALQADEN